MFVKEIRPQYLHSDNWTRECKAINKAGNLNQIYASDIFDSVHAM
jgi:hypothetical protein